MSSPFAAPSTMIRVAPIAIVLFPIRFFLGIGWLRAGVEKTIEETWWTGDALRGFLLEQHAEALPFMTPLVDGLLTPFAEPIGLAVIGAQFAIAIGFLSTRLLRPALLAAISLNVTFVAMGAVNPSVFYLVIEIALLAAVDLGAFGGAARAPSARRVGAKVGAALAFTPYISTLHPMHVIDDPAIILSTVAVIAAATEALGWAAEPRWPDPATSPSARPDEIIPAAVHRPRRASQVHTPRSRHRSS